MTRPGYLKSTAHDWTQAIERHPDGTARIVDGRICIRCKSTDTHSRCYPHWEKDSSGYLPE